MGDHHVGLGGLPPGHQGGVVLNQSYSYSCRGLTRRCRQRICDHEKLTDLRWVCTLEETLRMQGREHNYVSMLGSRSVYYLSAGFDGKPPDSRGLTSGPHADEPRTHNECLGSNSARSRSAWYCGRKQPFNMDIWQGITLNTFISWLYL